MSSSKILLFCVLFFIVGVAFGSFSPQHIFSAGVFIIFAGIFLSLLYHRPAGFFPASFLLFILLGGVHAFLTPQPKPVYQARPTITIFQPLQAKLLEVASENLSPLHDEIISAMMLGQDSAMSVGLKEKLNFSGLRHITAISGQHITLLTVILMEMFLALGFWRHQALLLSILVSAGYIVLVGAPPSAVRAGIMGGLLAVAQSFGRLSESSRAIFFAAALMLALNPSLLKIDIGFQLSFLATLGIAYLTPVILHTFRDLPEKSSYLKNIVAMTLSAQIFTFPLLIYHFGYLSLAALFSNILVLPILPLIMILALIFLAGGAIFDFLGWLLSLPLGPLLFYMTFIIDTFSSFSLSTLWVRISLPVLIVSYFILIILTWYLKRRHYFATLPF